MKILLLTDTLDRGGAETHVETLARMLTDTGDEVCLLSSGGEIARRLEEYGIRHVLMPPPSHSPIAFYKRRRILVRLLGEEHFDVLHAHTRLTALLLRTLRGGRHTHVVTVHAKFKRTPLSRLLSYWGRYTLAVSEDLADHTASAFGRARADIRVIPNGIDLSRYSPVKKEEDGITRILFASRLCTDCALGATLLLSLCAKFECRESPLRVTIAGGGDAYDRIRARAEEINRAHGFAQIFMAGHVTDMPALLSSHDIFIGVSRAAMEAAAMGCAVILCGNEGYLGLLTHENAAVASTSNLCARGFPKPTEQALWGTLLPLLEDAELRQRAGNAAREIALCYFDACEMVARHKALYRDVARAPLSVCIGGYFGCGNLGDDLILGGVLSYLQRAHPALRITALIDAKESHRPPSAHCIRRRSLLPILFALSRADAFLCGGGSLLQNKTGNLSLLYYLSLLRLARFMGAHSMLYAAGIGPITGAWAKRQTARTLARLPYLSLRDPDSLLALEALGISRERLHLSADAALLLPLPEGQARAHSPYACIIPATDKPHERLLECARVLKEKHSLSVCVLLFDRMHDRGSAQALARTLSVSVSAPKNAEEALSILAGASVALTERLHGMILSMRVGTPAVGLVRDTTDPKIPSFARMTELPVHSLCDTDAATLAQIAITLCKNERALRPKLLAHAQVLGKKAEKDLENVLELLYNEKENK